MPSDMTTLYYRCTACKRTDSQVYVPGYSAPYGTCPHCGGTLAFDPNCHTCKHLGVLSIPCDKCQDFSNYSQKAVD